MSANVPFRPEYTPIPNYFFGRNLDSINNLLELKVLLRTIFLIKQKKNYPQILTLNEIKADQVILNALPDCTDNSFEQLPLTLNGDIGSQLFIHMQVAKDDRREEIYILNIPANSKAINRIKNGDVDLPDLPDFTIMKTENSEKPTIFDLYESNIGILTPIIGEELKDAANIYPDTWIEDAFREAVTNNKRNWRYISRILQRWNDEGRDNGKPRGYSKKTDPKEYIRRTDKYIR
jgi:DnaD/phage-associated family protein